MAAAAAAVVAAGAGQMRVAAPTLDRAHVAALDGVRGLAVLLVLGHHFLMNVSFPTVAGAALLQVFRAGWFGVDLFFVLSGYLITGILVDAKNRPHFIRNFYIRRSLRIFPLYFAVLALCVLFAAWVMPANTDGQLRHAFPALALYATNFHQARGGYVEGQYLGFSHLWSLAVEEHFYLVWPWVILLVRKDRLAAVCAAGFIIVALLRAAYAAGGGDANVMYLLTPFRCDALLLGAWMAVTQRTHGLEQLRRPAAFVVAGGLLVLIAAIASAGGIARPVSPSGSFAYTGLALFFAALLCLVLTDSDLRRLFESRSLRALGKYSYGLYVFHWLFRPVFVQLMTSPRLTAHMGTGLAAAVGLLLWVAATALCVIVSWRFLERPLLALKDRWSAQPRLKVHP